MSLPTTGRADMPATATLYLANVTCSNPTGSNWFMTADVAVDSFAKWAGASPQPRSVKFTIPNGQPGAPDIKSYTATTILNIVWNIEDAPKQGAKQDYVLKLTSWKVDQGTCVPGNPTAVSSTPSRPMTVVLPDRTNPNETVGQEPCDQNPDQLKCQTATVAAGGNSPGFDSAIFLLGLVGLAIVYRRRD